MIRLTDIFSGSLGISSPQQQQVPMAEVEYIVAKYNYDAKESQELSVKKNERLVLVDDSGSWWKVRNVHNRVGLVPSNYVRRENWKDALGGTFDLIKESLKRKGSCDVKKVSLSTIPKQVTDGVSQRSFLTLPRSSIASHRAYRLDAAHYIDNNIDFSSKATCAPSVAFARYDYCPTRDDELKLTRGSEIEVLEKSADGWWRGQCGNHVGWFPSNYVDEHPQRFPAPAPPLALSPAPVSFVITNGSGCAGGTSDLRHILHPPEVKPEKIFASISEEIESRFEKPPAGAVDSTCDVASKSVATAASRGRSSLSQESWYFGAITREQSEKLLSEYGIDGDFLIRDSESNPGDFSVSLKAHDRNKHFWVRINGDMYEIGTRRFSSLEELIKHYTEYPIFTSDKGDKLYLVKPLAKRVT
uniref:Cytoplasmic protein NCK1 n=1 Tax=Soboliphyme baturini TaxID=241478 RepID=A0A183IPT0_9BILA